MKAPRHFRHETHGSEYFRHQVRLMRRWCGIYGRTEAEFVMWHASDYACRHDGAGPEGCLERGAWVSSGSPEDSVAGVDEDRS